MWSNEVRRILLFRFVLFVRFVVPASSSLTAGWMRQLSPFALLDSEIGVGLFAGYAVG